MSRPRVPRRRGFTLVEILVGSTVLVGLMFGAYNVFSSANREASLAAWTSSAQKELKLGLKRISNELAKASYYRKISPSEITYLDLNGDPGGTNPEDVEELFQVEVKLASSAPKTLAENTSPTITDTATKQRLLLWFQAEPLQEGVADEGYLAACEVFVEGGSIFLQRQYLHGNAAKVTEEVVELIRNVEEISTAARTKTDTSEILHGSMIDLQVRVHHPNTGLFPNSKLSQQTTFRVPVTFKT